MIRTTSLLVYSFGFGVFVALAVAWPRYGRPRLDRPRALYPAIFLTTAAWFALNLAALPPAPWAWPVLLASACVFPPLLGALFASPGWRIIPFAALALASAVALGTPRLLCAVLFCCLLIWGTTGVVRGGGQGRALIGYFAAVAVVVPAALLLSLNWMTLLVRSLPLTLLLVEAYAHRRFLFIDLFVKWGSYFLAGTLVSLGWLRFVAARFDPLPAALLLLPLLWAFPQFCRLLGAWIDRRFLRRRYSPAEANRIFLARLQGASSVEELDRAAREAHSEILRAPMYSEDVALAESLNEIHELARQRLELAGAARQSELKALRAQINPHFLFNALNTVAGLIPRRPAQAEATVERLADVFRYTLMRSEQEWVTLGEEIDFVQSWLDVEQARFGDRLTVRCECAPDARTLRLPAMVVQTLVENALKHGVAKTRGPAEVRVRCHPSARRVIIEVEDNGPGPQPGPEGHGLRNTRARLSGHFGPAAKLDLIREGGRTVARLEIPATCAS